ncbi:hypothetical protein CCO03_13555 [Comamonas serinivorans]|uniref:Uncharacterized protein n=1 Tax=Comamonas serinivorans TaxID=1082851 RepID=A0A1Y0EQP0_9BURK|nr:hypothetical protein CCO03_13555 [Comamonas serinivorans]
MGGGLPPGNRPGHLSKPTACAPGRFALVLMGGVSSSGCSTQLTAVNAASALLVKLVQNRWALPLAS